MAVTEAAPEEALARKRYIWKTGVLGFGGLMFVIMTLSDWYSKGYIHIPPFPILLRFTIPSLIIWPIAGYLFGAWTWRHRRNSSL